MTSVATAAPAELGSSQNSQGLDHRRPGGYPKLIIRIDALTREQKNILRIGKRGHKTRKYL
jgi:hypothetical protein